MKYETTEGMKIFEPIDINNMHLKNRIAIGPYGSHPAAPGGQPNEHTVNYYRTIANENVGFIMVGIVNPVPEDGGVEYKSTIEIHISSDDDIPGWKAVTDAIHEKGVKCGVQLGLFGLMAENMISEMKEDFNKYAWSDMFTGDPHVGLPEGHILSTEEVQKIIYYSGLAAGRAKAAGFDCISVHNAHSDIMFGACTLDPMFNNRTDGYGGDLEGRLRYTVELIQEIRKNVGEDFPITMRINGDDLKGELGNSLEDICKYIVPRLEEAGLDALDISQGGSMYAGQGCLPVLYYPRACWIPISSTIKKHANVPVFGVGRVTSLEMAEKIIREEKIDIIYLARQQYVDTDIIQKFKEGKNLPCDVRQCLGCDTRCFPCSMNYDAMGQLNPDFIIPMTPAEKPKKVLVVGGGVAGMEAARIAAKRGHNVTLWEAKGKLGGNVGIMATTPHLSEFQNAIDYLSGQMSAEGVNVRVCYEATSERIKEFAPDVLIVAAGTTEKLGDQYIGQPMVMTLFEAMERKREFRSFAQWHKKVWFQGFAGCEFALDLANEGAEVTMVGKDDAAVAAEPWFTRDRQVYLRKKLTDANYIRRSEDTQRANIRMLFRSKIEGVDADGVHYYNNGIHKVAPYDVLIVSSPRKRNDLLFKEFKDQIPEVYKIGDCKSPGLIQDAIRSANEVARKI